MRPIKITSSLFSIIIVNWNGKELLRNCLNSIIKTNSSQNYEIIVVDNASTDGSVNMIKREFQNVSLILNEENLGFSKATNIGIKASKSDFLLLLNTDTELRTPDILQTVEKFFAKNHGIGLVGLNLIFPNGVPQSPGGNFISNWQLFKQQVLFVNSPFFLWAKNRISSSGSKSCYHIDYASGACLFMRRELIEEVGLLDESFFMYGEDMEFCYRARNKGWHTAILPYLDVVHLRGQSTRKNIEQILMHSMKNNCWLINKFYGKKRALLAHVIYSFGLSIRLILAFFRKSEQPMSYWKLILSNLKLCFSY